MAFRRNPTLSRQQPELIKRPYTVMVPYTEMVDGVPTTRMRQETRMRSMQVTRGKTETKAIVRSEKYKIAEIKAYSVDGKELDAAAMKDHISDRTPVILVNDAKAISPYFKAILKPETVFLVCPGDITP